MTVREVSGTYGVTLLCGVPRHLPAYFDAETIITQ